VVLSGSLLPVSPRAARFLLLFAHLAPLVARADPAPAPQSRTGVYSRYEQETIDLVSKQRGWQVDATPEGKLIESIDVVALDVVEPRDPVPDKINWLHVTSRDHVIRREALLREGEPFRKVLADETARNLRRYSQLSVVLCVAVQGSEPGRVRLVLITKDVWSLRLNWDAALSSGGFERLVLAPTETNVLGYQHSAGGRLDLLPESYALSLRYSIPRVVGSRVAASAEAGRIFNRRSDRAEGSFGTLVVERPLYSTRTPWALRFSGTFRDEIYRYYRNAQLRFIDFKATPADDHIPALFRSQTASVVAAATRSFGWAYKNDLSAGVELVRRQYDVPSPDRYDPSVLALFRKSYVPTSDNRLSPFVQWRSYTSNFLRTLDLETLALQEDVRLGHDVSARLYPALASVGSTRSLVGASLSAGYTVPLDNGYARLSFGSTTEYQLAGPRGVADGSFSASARVVTPRLSVGRFLADGGLLWRYDNYLNRTSSLGGDGRLRGWPSSYVIGKNLVVYNFEYRTRPLQLFSMQLGGVFFYDVGDAPEALENLDPKQSVGLGFRALFPQLDRVVFRGDLGFPLQKGGLPSGVPPVGFFLSFLQAFGDER